MFGRTQPFDFVFFVCRVVDILKHGPVGGNEFPHVGMDDAFHLNLISVITREEHKNSKNARKDMSQKKQQESFIKDKVGRKLPIKVVNDQKQQPK